MRRPKPESLADFAAEADFQRTVLDMAAALGWVRFHDHDSRRDNERSGVDRGFPDLVLLKVYPDRISRVVFAELKTERGRLSADQRRWMEGLMRLPEVEAYVWKPSDMDEIERVLRG